MIKDWFKKAIRHALVFLKVQCETTQRRSAVQEEVPGTGGPRLRASEMFTGKKGKATPDKSKGRCRGGGRKAHKQEETTPQSCDSVGARDRRVGE